MNISNHFSISTFKFLGVRTSIAYTVTSTIFASIIFYVGIILQSVIDASLGISDDRARLIHGLSNCDCLLPKLSFTTTSGIIIPSFLFFVLFTVTKAKNWKTAALYGALVLIIYDIGLELIYGVGTLSLSLACNVIGGPIAGIIIGYLLRSNLRIFTRDKLKGSIRSFAYISAIAVSLTLFFSTLYGLILYPLPRDATLVASKEDSHVFVTDEDRRDFKVRTDSVFKEVTENFPVQDLFIMAATKSLRVNSQNETEFVSLSFPNTENVSLTAMGFYGCQSNKEVISLFKKNKELHQKLNVKADEILDFESSTTKITAVSKSSDDDFLLYLGGNVVQADIVEDKTMLSQFKSADIGLHLKSGMYLFISGTPSPDKFFEKNGYVPEKTHEYDSSKLIQRNKEEVVDQLNLYPIDGCNCVCTAQNPKQSLPENKTVTGAAPHGFILKVDGVVTSSKPFVKMHIPTTSQILYGSANDNILGRDTETLKISAYSGKIKTGKLNYGLKSISLENAWVRLTGEDLTATQPKEGVIQISGRAAFIDINGTIVTKTLLSSVDVSIIVVFLTAMLGGLAYGLRKYGKIIAETFLVGDRLPFDRP